MECLILAILAITVFLILFKPDKEKIVFYLLLCGALLNAFMYFVASFNSILPSGNY